jgi:hypothetical protein
MSLSRHISPSWPLRLKLRELGRRIGCAIGRHDLQIQFTIPSGRLIEGQLSCVTCDRCGWKWAACLEDENFLLIPFWTLYSAEVEIAMREENERNGIA